MLLLEICASLFFLDEHRSSVILFILPTCEHRFLELQETPADLLTFDDVVTLSSISHCAPAVIIADQRAGFSFLHLAERIFHSEQTRFSLLKASWD